MTQLDYFVFVVAGAVGALVDSRFGWIILAVWGVAKCLHIL